jgi:hypothetical protein
MWCADPDHFFFFFNTGPDPGSGIGTSGAEPGFGLVLESGLWIQNFSLRIRIRI